MSDTDDADDGGFDKEAEREKLRQKFEEEEESRQATQQMSELLLKGATMTNSHCSQCGNPIFRQNGQEFCPTCGEAVGENADTDADEPIDVPAEAAESQAAEGQADHADGTGQASATDEEQPRAAAESDDAPPESGETARARSQDSRDGRERREATARTEVPGQRSAGRDEQASRGRDAAGGDLGDARAALVRTLTDLARRAEDAGDVRRTRDLLGAAREAAEAIEALDRADR